MVKFSVKTRRRREMVDITAAVNKAVQDDQMDSGCCLIFIPHTTCGVTINENADPDVSLDILNTLEKLVPPGGNYHHTEGNADAHVASSLVGHSVIVPVVNGRLALGTWQGIFLCEFDGPRSREVWVRTLAARRKQE